MSTITERISRHWKDRIANDVNSIDVYEWGETKENDKGEIEKIPLTVYFRPMPLKDRDKVLSVFNSGDINRAMLERFVLQARNEDGSKMFRPIEAKELAQHGVDMEVVARITEHMASFDVGDEDLDEIEKK